MFKIDYFKFKHIYSQFFFQNTHVFKKVELEKMQTAIPEKAPDPQTVHRLADERYIYEHVRFEADHPEPNIDVLLLCTVEGQRNCVIEP